ncbi:MAG: hypothetical protein ACR2GY_02900 [Phycisphaerales bacterium]
MESSAHANLKRLACAYLMREGYLAAAIEVRCPGSRYRVDAAGYGDREPHPPRTDAGGNATLWAAVERPRRAVPKRCEPRTIIIECKQSRSDFIREDQQAEELLALRDELRAWQLHMEEHRLKQVEPALRISNSALFAEMEEWDFSASRMISYRRLLRRIRRTEQQLHGATKFSLMSRYRLADALYIAAPRGLIRKREVPPGWGLLEWSREGIAGDISTLHEPASEAHPRVTVAAPVHVPRAEQRSRLLRNIAVAATRMAMHGHSNAGVERAEPEIRPD